MGDKWVCSLVLATVCAVQLSYPSLYLFLSLRHLCLVFFTSCFRSSPVILSSPTHPCLFICTYNPSISLEYYDHDFIPSASRQRDQVCHCVRRSPGPGSSPNSGSGVPFVFPSSLCSSRRALLIRRDTSLCVFPNNVVEWSYNDGLGAVQY